MAADPRRAAAFARPRARPHARACRPDLRQEPRRARRRRAQDQRRPPAAFRTGRARYRYRQALRVRGSEKQQGRRYASHPGRQGACLFAVLPPRRARPARLLAGGSRRVASRHRLRLAQRLGRERSVARPPRLRQHRAGGERDGARRARRFGLRRQAAPAAGFGHRLRQRLPDGVRRVRRARPAPSPGRQLAGARRSGARRQVDRRSRRAAGISVARRARRPPGGRAAAVARRDRRARRPHRLFETRRPAERDARVLDPPAGAARLPSAGMDFRLTPEQQQFRDSVLRFSTASLASGALARAHKPEYPWDVAKLMAKQGLLGITIGEADGGQGGNLTDAVLAIEAVASVCPRSADVIQAGNFGPIRVLAEYGSAFQKDRFLKKLLAGETVISVGMTEPDAGSAVTDLKTSATAEGDGYRINGSKIFTTHSAYADVILTYVRFGPGVGGIGSVLIPTNAPGVRRGKPSTFMSGEEWAELHFDNVQVPADMVLLKEGGFKKQIGGFNVERIGNASRSLALGRYAFERARGWALRSEEHTSEL